MTQEMINLISRLEKATEKLESIAGISRILYYFLKLTFQR
jgi:hypothetical protein